MAAIQNVWINVAIYRGHLEKYLHPLITFNAVAILSRWQKLRFTVECLCIQRRKITWGYCKTMRSEWKKERSVLILILCVYIISYDLVGLNLYRKFSPNYLKSRVIGNGILKNRPMISRTVMTFDIFSKITCVNTMYFNDY